MLISSKIEKALNQQIGMEFAASLQYDAIGAYFDEEALPNLAKHFYAQSSEERMHAHKFMKFVIDAGGHVSIPSIAAPVSKFSAACDAVKLSLKQEIAVTEAINSLADEASKAKDHTTLNFLQWFIEEQLEEVSSMDQLLKIVERAGESNLLWVEDYLQRQSTGKTED